MLAQITVAIQVLILLAAQVDLVQMAPLTHRAQILLEEAQQATAMELLVLHQQIHSVVLQVHVQTEQAIVHQQIHLDEHQQVIATGLPVHPQLILLVEQAEAVRTELALVQAKIHLVVQQLQCHVQISIRVLRQATLAIKILDYQAALEI